MRFLLSALFCLSVVPAAVAQDLVAKTDAKSPADELKCFKLPPGFEAQLVASEPDIQKPMQIAFDGTGKLWVTTSYHYPFAADEGKGTDKLFVLSDFGDDGKAKKVTLFYDKLNIPIGVLPLPDGKSVIVSECSRILKLTDTDGDGKADKREVLYSGFGVKDTHGMTNSFTLMPDGWVYACHGFKNVSKTKGKDGHEISMESGHTFRFKTDGSRIEVFTRGQVNPFGMCVDPWLNLYTADCHSKPMTMLVRGAHYDSFGAPHDGLGLAPHVINHMHGSTGLCGLVYYAADHFPKEWADVMFVGNCVTSRINCDKINWTGATPAGKELPDFLTSSDPWFRPVDIKLGPDGALYVSDFYNKIVGHYEVDLKHPGRDKNRGRVWRIVYKGKDGKGPSPAFHRKDWTQASEAELFADFIHPNTTVRLTAANEAATRGKFQPVGDILLAKIDRGSELAGMAAMVMERTGEMKIAEYETIVKYGKDNPDKVKPESLTGTLVRALVSRDKWGAEERKIALQCFTDFDNVRVKRAVVDGMTAHPDAEFVAPLLKFIPTIAAGDNYFKHAAKIALRNCLQEKGGLAALRNAGNWSYTPPLIDALKSLGSREATVTLVSGMKSMTDTDRLTVADAVGRTLPPDDWAGFSQYVRRAATEPQSLDHAIRLANAAFEGSGKVGFKKFENSSVGDDLEDALDQGLRAKAPLATRMLAARTTARWARQFGPASVHASSILVNDIMTGLGEKGASADFHAAFLDALDSLEPKKARPLIRELVADAAQPLAVRQQFAPLMMTAPSTADSATAKDAIKTAPYSLALTLAVGLAGDKFGADLLLTAVKTGEAPARLLQEKAVVDRLRATKVADLDKKIADLTKGILPPDKRIEALLKTRADGFKKAKPDAAKGKEVFAKSCAICHQLNNEGAKVGPHLDGVGIRGLERLLEDTLDPNRNVDAAFKSTTLVLADGRTPTGLVREDGNVFVLIDGMGKENRYPKDDVEKKVASNLSAMPANVDTTVSETDYYHLLAYLLQQRPK